MRLAIVGVALALVLGGCAGGEKPSTAPSADPDARNLRFAQCLREQGLDVPDPEPGKGMTLKFGPDSDQRKVQAAMEACREWAPSGALGGGAPDPKQEERMREQSQCMRDNGVEAFPDPENGGIRIDGGVAEDPDFEAAEKACASIMQGAR
ncbi:hypothetical protein [Actinoplanes flavus]|uniref:Secreted protein n=1 Tax=Actinoplanes flavus TaxID=2820290 RepID=A0ABS3UGQ8_9ACTN|nr:hypothetical protein [Actinoplanes flavus]MBO3737964.1 hypothetical protein [Actinoplanes flavus]